MRKRRLIYNTITSLADEVVAMLCGIILPRFFLEYYGSAVNGLVSSITQFLSFIAFLDLGVGAVVQSSLYKPLAEKNEDEISKIYSSANKFFKTIASIFLVYVMALIAIYPLVIKNQFDFVFTATLIAAIAITQFSQYFFGIVNQLLLNAAQKNYIPMLLHIFVLIANTIICIILMKLGFSIQIVKLASSMIFFLRPIGMSIYVAKNYRINRTIKYDKEPITQKWNGLAQHVTSVVLDNTDVALLTLFSSLENVSIYNVYYLVVHGIRKVIERFSTGMQSLLGDIYACRENEKLQSVFQKFEFSIHFFVVFLFGCTGVLLVPFVKVYTLGITDVNYNLPLFGAILTAAQAMYCLRVPYMMMVKAAGHYKQTQNSAITEMVLNLTISVILIIRFGLIGVAIGTLAAMIYRTLYLAAYSYKNFIQIGKMRLVKLFAVDLIEVAVIVLVTRIFHLGRFTYLSWGIMAVKVSVVSIGTLVIISLLVYKDEMISLIRKIIRR